MRFSLKKCCTTPRPRPSPPKIAASGTRTSVSDTWAWSVGMLKVQRYSSTLKPGASAGTRKAVIPRPSPGSPEVRANIRSASATCTPVFQVFSPLITQSGPSLTARVSMYVASEPCSGSVMPNPNTLVPPASPSTHAAFCSSEPYSNMSSRPTLLPTMACSFCRSQCNPRPRRARCSRMTAIPRLDPSRPPNSAGKGYRKCPATSARLRASPSNASHSLLGRPPRSQSVRESSRRWSKNRMLSSACSSGTISRSMNPSSSAR
ncbi:Uncharacterised protein [Mycobacteroides abscessus subsp. abscessus]|nr:Uncharacterised protein [Mycobacteroides abscessus subsp. abscessus]